MPATTPDECDRLGGMSPVSRSRKKKSTQRVIRSAPPITEVECDCPTCSDSEESLDPREMIDDLIASAAELLKSEDPMDAELAGATFVSFGEIAGEGFDEALLDGFIPEIAARATPEAVALLLAIGAVADDPANKAASAAAGKLVEAGVAAPPWAAELAEPVTFTDCCELSDPQDTGSVLTCSFHRAGRSHAILVTVDHIDCGAADNILLLDTGHLPETLEAIRASGLEAEVETLDGAEFRWRMEKALDARAVHDRDEGFDEDSLPDEDGPGYPVLARLVRARMNALPVPTKPAAPHPSDDDEFSLDTLEILQGLTANTRGPLGFGSITPIAARRGPTAKLPAKRKKSDGPAPVYQIKVSLRGATPPIWRRLEVPADISLAQLHEILQTAFDWEDSHMHVFETPFGNFGMPDADLGHRAEAPVTLEQVAPAVKSKILYTYDFGDDWDHDIVVEKILDRDPSVTYPRCTGGRRAAPPEDCGGIWGYAELIDVLKDPSHPEHDDRLEWLGLDNASEFDPAEFSAEEVTEELARMR